MSILYRGLLFNTSLTQTLRHANIILCRLEFNSKYITALRTWTNETEDSTEF